MNFWSPSDIIRTKLKISDHHYYHWVQLMILVILIPLMVAQFKVFWSASDIITLKVIMSDHEYYSYNQHKLLISLIPLMFAQSMILSHHLISSHKMSRTTTMITTITISISYTFNRYLWWSSKIVPCLLMNSFDTVDSGMFFISLVPSSLWLTSTKILLLHRSKIIL